MVQILRHSQTERPRTFAQSIVGGLAEGIPGAISQYSNAKRMQQENAAATRQGIDLSGVSDPKARQAYIAAHLQGKNQEKLENQKQKGREDLYNKKQDFVTSLFGQKSNQPEQNQSHENEELNPTQKSKNQSEKPLKYSNEQIAQATVVDHNLAVQMRHANDTLTRQEEQNTKNSREERAFETSYSKKAVEEADNLRTALPKLEMSLDFARNAVESGDVGALSLANIGERLNIPELQTAKGAQLTTAAKENLLGTISRVSARSQNKWFEQRVNSMMAQIGRSKEANLAAQELLEAEVAASKVYLNEFDRLAKDDNKNYGFERKDIKKRAHDAAKAQEDHIFKRSIYRLQELDENEKGLSSMKSEVGKNVTKGKPLTMAMAKLYRDKFGKENALKMAEKNGYNVPSLEEFASFQQQPREFREDL
jgi:hypothetical protein